MVPYLYMAGRILMVAGAMAELAAESMQALQQEFHEAGQARRSNELEALL